MNLLLIILVVCIQCSNRFQYVFPSYDFKMHNPPVVYVNDTEIQSWKNFYEEMKEISVVHTLVSGVVGLVTTTVFLPAVPLPLGYWAYHTYMLYYSSHMHQKCEFILEGDSLIEQKRFYRSTKLLNYIPDWLLEPAAFAFHCWLAILFYTIFWKKKKIWHFVLLLLLLFYTYSFFQTLRSFDKITIVKRNNVMRELVWKCHSLKMTFTEKMKLTWLSFFGMHTDEYGFVINSKCQKLEEKLNELEINFVSVIYVTIMRSLLTIIREILGGISLTDKFLFIFTFLAICSIKYQYSWIFKKKKSSQICQKIEEEKEVKNKDQSVVMSSENHIQLLNVED